MAKRGAAGASAVPGSSSSPAEDPAEAKAKRKGGELVISGVETFKMLAVVPGSPASPAEDPDEAKAKPKRRMAKMMRCVKKATNKKVARMTRKETTFTEFPGSTARSALHRWIRSDGARRLMLRPVRPRPDFQVTEVQERGGIFYVGASRAMEAHNKAEEP